jgi:hypothetical protein
MLQRICTLTANNFSLQKQLFFILQEILILNGLDFLLQLPHHVKEELILFLRNMAMLQREDLQAAAM